MNTEVRYGAWYPDPRYPDFHLRHLSCPRCGALIGRQQTADPDDGSPFEPGAITLDARVALDPVASAARGIAAYQQPVDTAGRPRPPVRREVRAVTRRDGTGITLWRPARPQPGTVEPDGQGGTVWFAESGQLPCDVRCRCRRWLRISGRHAGDPRQDAAGWEAYPATPINIVVDPRRGRGRKRPVVVPTQPSWDRTSRVYGVRDLSRRPKRHTDDGDAPAPAPDPPPAGD